MSSATEDTITFNIITTFTNSQTHTSPSITITITCNNNYVISAASSTSPQFVTHGDGTVGFTLPAYTSAQQTGCPVNSRLIDNNNGGGASPPSGLPSGEIPAVSGTYIVKPTNNGAHQAYTFYVRVGALGGKVTHFGPYVLNVGCFSGSYTFSIGAFATAPAKFVGDATASAYTVVVPTTNRAYCVALTHEVVQSNGATWTSNHRLSPTGS